MRRESHVRFREGAGVRFPRATRLVVLCHSQAEAEAALPAVRGVLAALGLTLSEEKTRIVHVEEASFTFLGYTFYRTYRFPSDRAMRRLRAKLRPVTRRQQPQRLPAVIERVNPILRGWFQYFQHSRRPTFEGVDGWVRMRLRSLLRKRSGRRGRGRGADHQRWPNAYFREQGLYSLTAAHRLACRSL